MLPAVYFAQTVPTEITDRLPDADQIVGEVQANPALLAILVIVGLLTGMLFLWGIVKQAVKAAVFAGLASAGVWYWYFNIR
jgi:hypothetical protein